MTSTSPGSPADVLLVDGSIVTMDPVRPRAQALAVRGGRIAALGATAELLRLAGPPTVVVDLRGRMAMPGLIDAHCHPAKGAIANLFSCRFEFTATPEEIARVLGARTADDPASDWVIGGRWDSGFFDRYRLPSPREWLDRHSRGRAVYFRDDSGHNGWASSEALRRLGITRDTPDPGGGTIVRDVHTGEPNGLLLEEADVAARARLPDWTAAQYRAGVLEMVRIANRYGITGVTDADATEPLLKAYQAVDREGGLSLYVAASISTPYGRREEPLDYDRLDRLRECYASEHVDTRSAKIYEDGVPTAARTAAMLAPYLPHAGFPPGHRGVLHVDEATLAADIAELERRSYTVKLHTAGDRSIRIALDAIEKAHRTSGRRDLRHELAHAGFIDPDDLPRFAQLNVAADLSPYIWHPSPLNDSVAGAVGERARRYWPIRDLLESGAPLLAGSDWPAAVASMDPWIGIEAMITRRDPAGKAPGALWPEQAIALGQALKIFTLDGARALRQDARTGSLAVGKSADLIVLDRNLFDIPAEDVADTQVDLTLFAGRVVHTRGPG